MNTGNTEDSGSIISMPNSHTQVTCFDMFTILDRNNAIDEYIVTGCNDNSILLFRKEEFSQVAKLRDAHGARIPMDWKLVKRCKGFHVNAVSSITILDKQNRKEEERHSSSIFFASGSMDSTIQLWKFDKHSPNLLDNLTSLEYHKDWVRDLLELENFRLASSSRDKTVCVWDLNRDYPTAVCSGFSKMVWSMANLDSKDLLGTATTDGYFSIWDIKEKKPFLKSSKFHSDLISSITPISNSQFITTGFDGLIKMWDFRSLSKPIFRASTDSPIISAKRDELNEKMMVTCSKNGSVHCWNVEENLKPVQILLSPRILLQDQTLNVGDEASGSFLRKKIEMLNGKIFSNNEEQFLIHYWRGYQSFAPVTSLKPMNTNVTITEFKVDQQKVVASMLHDHRRVNANDSDSDDESSHFTTNYLHVWAWRE